MSSDGRKVEYHLQNPIDALFVKIAKKLDPFFVSVGMTPNRLTTISGIFGFMAAYYIYKKKYIIGAILYTISYMFDCFDEYYARAHDMVTKLGDYYDHIKDWTVMILIFYLLYKDNSISKSLKVGGLVFYVIIFISTLFYIGCEENYYHLTNSTNKSETLSITTKLCSKHMDSIVDKLKIRRYHGLGTLTLYIVVILIIIQLKGFI
jgi:phosphatidylglycerophosphate synthase